MDVLLVTGSDMPERDHETVLLVDALAAVGRRAEIVPWTGPVDWAGARLVVIRSTWDYTLHAPEFLAWADAVDTVTALRNPASVVRWNAHKGYLLELRNAGVPVVPTLLVGRSADPSSRAEAVASWPGELVVKPAVSAGAAGTLRVSGAAAAAHLAALVARGDALVQPFVPAVAAAGEVSLVYLGGAFSHAVRKVPVAGDFRVQERHGGSALPHTATPAELDVGRRALALAPGAVSYARVDLVTVDGGPAVMELELIEPELFLGRDPAAADRFAAHLAALQNDEV